MSDEDVARRIVCCAGARGPNLDYLTNTLRHLEALGVHDAHVARIYEVVQALTGAAQ
jgi:cation transport protein ChaC